MKIAILRLGHRKGRDIRVTTHCCLVARAFFASELVLSGESDASIIETVSKVSKKWGGGLKLSYRKNFLSEIRQRKRKGFLIVHLTMYGLSLPEHLAEIRKIASKKGILVIIGAEKVPASVYALSDFNIAITNQPHSEVAALAIFLNELQNGSPLQRNAQRHFKNAQIIITPGQKDGKSKKTKSTNSH
ncbi:MAG: tRNA (cytidine(56)-2'-O)-methyltransferase [Candidatus Micrarchaeota archaeon]